MVSVCVSGGQVGQRVLEVNDSSLLGITHEEAVAVMRSAGSTIRLVVCDGYDYGLVSIFLVCVLFCCRPSAPPVSIICLLMMLRAGPSVVSEHCLL